MTDTATINIDADYAIELLERVVEDVGPDYVYPYETCAYVLYNSYLETVGPGCIVGRALVKAGVGIEAFMHEDQIPNTPIDYALDSLERYGVYLTEEAVIAFLTAQIEQDGNGIIRERQPYRRAVDNAKVAARLWGTINS